MKENNLEKLLKNKKIRKTFPVFENKNLLALAVTTTAIGLIGPKGSDCKAIKK